MQLYEKSACSYRRRVHAAIGEECMQLYEKSACSYRRRVHAAILLRGRARVTVTDLQVTVSDLHV
jgi:hypothetical protein